MASDPAEPWRATKGGVRLAVRLSPRAARDAVEGIEERPEGRFLRASVRALPEAGAANEALLRLIADWLGVPRRDVTLAGGRRARYKQVEIAGEEAAILGRLREKLGRN